MVFTYLQILAFVSKLTKKTIVFNDTKTHFIYQKLLKDKKNYFLGSTKTFVKILKRSDPDLTVCARSSTSGA